MAANEGTEVITAGSNNNLLQKIREPKTLLFILFLLVLIAILAVSAFYLNKKSQQTSEQGPPAAAVVNGKTIPKQDYESVYNAQLYYFNNLYKKEIGEEPSKEIVKSLPNVVLDNLIEEALLADYLEKKGVKIDEASVKERIQKQVVDPQYKGDQQVYEKELQEKYKTSLANIMRTFRTGVMIEKVVEIEKLKPEEFGSWYSDLRSKADIKINISEYKK